MKKLPENWRKENATHLLMKGKSQDLGNYRFCRLVSLALISGKAVKQLTLGTISRHVKDDEVIRSRHHRMMN